MNENTFNLTEQRGITKTNFATVPVVQTTTTGVRLGQGKCKAVILRLNNYTRNSTDGTQQSVEQVYFGDASRQEFELIRGTNSEIIFCNNLDEIWIRNPDAAKAEIQVMIYD